MLRLRKVNVEAQRKQVRNGRNKIRTLPSGCLVHGIAVLGWGSRWEMECRRLRQSVEYLKVAWNKFQNSLILLFLLPQTSEMVHSSCMLDRYSVWTCWPIGDCRFFLNRQFQIDESVKYNKIWENNQKIREKYREIDFSEKGNS